MASQITRLLHRWSEGEARALDELAPLVHRELRSIAARFMAGERADHTLQPTALVNEAFLKLAEQDDVDWQSRDHFFAVAARLMRRILVDHARRVQAEKRGGTSRTLSLQELESDAPEDSALLDILTLHEALQDLADLDERLAETVELRYFGGLTIEQTADLLDTSAATVKRDWTTAKAWLQRRLQEHGAP